MSVRIVSRSRQASFNFCCLIGEKWKMAMNTSVLAQMRIISCFEIISRSETGLQKGGVNWLDRFCHIMTVVWRNQDTYTHTHTYMHTYTHSHTYMHTYMHTYIHTHTHTHKHTCTHTHTHSNTQPNNSLNIRTKNQS